MRTMQKTVMRTMQTSFCVVLAACAVLSGCSCSHKKDSSTSNNGAAVDSLPRSAITFILGKDENPRNPYYRLADDYYRLSDSEKTEIVVDTIYTLTGVLDYLAHYPAANHRPWGKINLVSHGNEFIDLSVSVSPGGPRVSDASIRQAIDDTTIKPLDTTIVDRRTMIDLHGCAVGNNIGLLRMLGVAFGGKNPIPAKASRMFEYYGNTSQSGNPQFIRHYYARAWYAFFHPDSLLSDSAIAVLFRQRYPTDDVNWEDAVGRYHPETPAEAYNMRMFIPVVWQDFYDTRQAMPDVRSKYRQDKWVENKPEFQALMDKTNIPRQCFQIKFYADEYPGDSGNIYGLKAKARAGVVCVIRPVLRQDTIDRSSFPPYVPAPNDTTFFGFAE